MLVQGASKGFKHAGAHLFEGLLGCGLDLGVGVQG